MCFDFEASAQDCQRATINQPVIIKQSISTASIWANYWQLPGSISFDAKEILLDAQTFLYLEQSKHNNCSTQKEQYINFIAIPEKFISNDYVDKDSCDALLIKTNLQPFIYTNTSSRQIDEIAIEFMQISKGTGAIGKDIYARCPGRCSPQYQITLRPLADGFQTQLQAICGPARDKDNNNYILSSHLLEETK